LDFVFCTDALPPIPRLAFSCKYRRIISTERANAQTTCCIASGSSIPAEAYASSMEFFAAPELHPPQVDCRLENGAAHARTIPVDQSHWGLDHRSASPVVADGGRCQKELRLCSIKFATRFSRRITLAKWEPNTPRRCAFHPPQQIAGCEKKSANCVVGQDASV